MADYYYLEGFQPEDLLGIACEPWLRPTAHVETSTGVRFERDLLPAVEGMLGMTLATNWRNAAYRITSLVLPNAVQLHGRGWAGFHAPYMRRGLELWTPYFGQPFHAYISNYDRDIPQHKGWTVLVDRGLQTSRMVDGTWWPRTPTYITPENWGDQYILIRIDGNIVAGFTTDNRRIYLRAVGNNPQWWANLCSHLPTNRAPGIPPPPPDYEKLYVELRTKGFVAQRENIASQLRSVQQDLEQYQRAMVERLQSEGNLIRQLRAYEDGDKKDEELKDEFAQLKAVGGIKNLIISGSAIVAETDTIFVEADGDKWELGDYRINIGTNGKIRITNSRIAELLKSTGGGFYNDIQHPHVYDGGAYVCLGNLQVPVAKLIGAGDFPTALAVLVKFLNHINEKEHDGVYIQRLRHHWTPITEGEDKVEESTGEEPTVEPTVEETLDVVELDELIRDGLIDPLGDPLGTTATEETGTGLRWARDNAGYTFITNVTIP